MANKNYDKFHSFRCENKNWNQIIFVSIQWEKNESIFDKIDYSEDTHKFTLDPNTIVGHSFLYLKSRFRVKFFYYINTVSKKKKALLLCMLKRKQRIKSTVPNSVQLPPTIDHIEHISKRADNNLILSINSAVQCVHMWQYRPWTFWRALL